MVFLHRLSLPGGREAEARLKFDVSASNRKLCDKSDEKITRCKK